MRIQPKLGKNYYRIDTHTALIESIRKKIDQLAAIHNCSKSFVTATLLAQQLGIEEQPDYEISKRDQRKSDKRRGTGKIIRIEQRKRNSA